MFYAEIDATGKCFHITEDKLPLSDTIIEVDENVLGKVWNGTTWNEPEQPVRPAEETLPLTEKEQIMIDTVLNVEYMVCLMEATMM